MNKARLFLAAFGLAFLIIMITSVDRIIKIENNKPIETKTISSVIDSVWFTSPGQENTLQTDYRYYAKTANGQVVVSTDRAFSIGDSIMCIYHRYENTKTQKK
jgi:hypothetical protein